MHILLDKQVINWKGTKFVNELFRCAKKVDLSPLTQVQAVTFSEDGRVVLYKHIDGYFGLPGGKIEENETPDEALIREIREEINAEVINFGVFAFVRSYKENNPKNVTYNLRYWAIVDINKEGVVRDPAGKALERILVDVENVSRSLNWGRTGEVLIDEARKEFLRFKKNN